MTSGQDHHARYVSALSRISGQGGEPTVVDFDHSLNALADIAGKYPPAKAKLAVLTALGCGPGTLEDANKLKRLFTNNTEIGKMIQIFSLNVVVNKFGCTVMMIYSLSQPL